MARLPALVLFFGNLFALFYHPSVKKLKENKLPKIFKMCLVIQPFLMYLGHPAVFTAIDTRKCNVIVSGFPNYKNREKCWMVAHWRTLGSFVCA